ncbi:hypothetical protein GCM10020220_099240 [Nonomuraea rubra]
MPSPFGAGLGNAMALSYTLTGGYSGRSRPVNGYCPACGPSSCGSPTPRPARDVLLQLSDGASYEAH